MNPDNESALVEILMIIVSGREPHYCDSDVIEFRDRDNLIQLSCSTRRSGLVEVEIYEGKFTSNQSGIKPHHGVAIFNPPLYNAVEKRISDAEDARIKKAEAEAQAMNARRIDKVLSLLKP